MGQAAHDRLMEKLKKRLGVPLGGLVLHHKNPNMFHDDFYRYQEWREEDIVLLDQRTHSQLHCALRLGVPIETATQNAINEFNKRVGEINGKRNDFNQ